MDIGERKDWGPWPSQLDHVKIFSFPSSNQHDSFNKSACAEGECVPARDLMSGQARLDL